MRNITRSNYEPKIGDYHNMIVHDPVLNHLWLFDCDGVYTSIGREDLEKLVDEKVEKLELLQRVEDLEGLVHQEFKLTVAAWPDNKEKTFFVNEDQMVCPVYVDWGDGTVEEVIGEEVTNQHGPDFGRKIMSHTYSVTEEKTFQITFYPKKWRAGWLGFFAMSSYGDSTATNNRTLCIKSFDTPIPDRAIVLGPQNMTARFITNGPHGYEKVKVPEDFLDGIAFDSNYPTDPRRFFASAFYDWGYAEGITIDRVLEWVKKALSSLHFVGPDFSEMFSHAFERAGIKNIPEGLFSGLDTSDGENFSSMFRSTFSVNSIVSIPEHLFQIDTSNGTNFSEMFSDTFHVATGANDSSVFKKTQLQASEVDNLFSDLNTSRGKNFESMFRSVFFEVSFTSDSKAYFPDTIFRIDTSHGTNFAHMFQSVFEYATFNNLIIPKTLFSRLDTRKGTNFDHIFSGTFRATKFSPDLEGAIPDDLFQIDTSNGTDLSDMFDLTFDGSNFKPFNGKPPRLFSRLNTKKAKSLSGLFHYTFGSTQITSIPADYFNNIDTSNAEDLSNLFSMAFHNSHITTIPEGLFSHLDFSNAKDLSGMFQQTFFGCSHLTSIPDKVFSGITIPTGLPPLPPRDDMPMPEEPQERSPLESMFVWVFMQPPAVKLGDPFEGAKGLDTFDPAGVCFQMFGAGTGSAEGHTLTGKAQPIIDHFAPTEGLVWGFYGQNQLEDWNTIPENWKGGA